MLVILASQHSYSQDFASLRSTGALKFDLGATLAPADSSSASGGKEALNTIPAFYAKRSKKLVELTWQPATEESKSVFLIQRKSAKGWETIAYIPCSATSEDNVPSVYSYVDEYPSKSVTQYRIKEVIYHTIVRGSDIVPVDPEHHAAQISVGYSGGKIRLTFRDDGLRDIKIFDEKGKLVQEATDVKGRTTYLAMKS